MSSIAARVGHFPDNTRRAVNTLWRPGNRKRGDWVCAECRAKTVGGAPRRHYSDGTFRIDGVGGLSQVGNEVQEEAEQKPRSHWGLGTRASPTSGAVRDDRRAQTAPSIKQGFFSSRASGTSEREQTMRTALWEHSEMEESDETDSRASANVVDEMASLKESSLLDIDYQNNFSPALLQEEADMVLRCLFSASQANDLEWIRAIPTTTFSEAIRILAPSNFVAKLASAHIELSNAMTRSMDISAMRQIAFEAVAVLRQMIGIRRSAGVNITLNDYIVLLRTARDLGNQRMGFIMWNNLLDDGLIPTTQAYNYYMSAVVWNGVHSAAPRHKVRVIPFHMMARARRRLSSKYRNYRVGPEGMRATAMRIFNEMLANGATANEESFRILVTAAAREGDMATVKSVLKKVWGIDIDAIVSGQDEASIALKAFTEQSPMRPTERLLWTIAHACGINNDIPAALRTVDLVSRHYGITLSHEVWSQLFEWTFVLAIKRHGTSNRDGSKVGQLPPQSVLSLWETMTGDPYFVEPSMGMYNMLIKNLFERQYTPKIMDFIREGTAVASRHRQRTIELFEKLRYHLKLRAKHVPHDSIESLRNEWEFADLLRQRNVFWMKRWIRLLLGSFNHWCTGDSDRKHFAKELPTLLWAHRSMAPSNFRYETPTGYVELAFRDEEEILQNSRGSKERTERNNRVLEEALKYIGHEWVRGRQFKPTKRMRERDGQQSM